MAADRSAVSWLAEGGGRQEDAFALGIRVGLAGGAWLLPHRSDLCWGDAEVARAAGIAGGIAGVCIGYAVDPNSDDADADGRNAGVLIGATLGLWAGDRLVRDTEFSWMAATRVDLAVLAGTLCPLVFLPNIDPDVDNRYAGLVGAGAVAGWVIAYATLRDENRPIGHSSIQIDASPLAVAALLNRRAEPRTGAPAAAR